MRNWIRFITRSKSPETSQEFIKTRMRQTGWIKVFELPLKCHEEENWILYNQGEELGLSFFSQDQNENLCLKTALSHYKDKQMKFYLDEYSALYQDFRIEILNGIPSIKVRN